MPIWPPGQADGRLAQILDGHRHQGDRLLLAGGQQHVHFAGEGVALTSSASSISSSVLWPAGTDDHHDLVAGPLGGDGPGGRGPNLWWRRRRSFRRISEQSAPRYELAPQSSRR